MTPQAIRDGFDKLRSDKQMLGLADAARSRSEADWLVGINGTRAMTAFNSRDGGFFLTTVGRVQTPTLSIVVEREEKIRKHVSRDYWEVRPASTPGRPVRGQVVRPGVQEGRRRRSARRPAVERGRRASHRQAVRGQPATVDEEASPARRQPAAVRPDHAAARGQLALRLQAKTTLSMAQALYEKHKVLTYPRTDSRALPEDYLGTVKDTFR
jgi:DNA topoisomerase-3